MLISWHNPLLGCSLAGVIHTKRWWADWSLPGDGVPDRRRPEVAAGHLRLLRGVDGGVLCGRGGAGAGLPPLVSVTSADGVAGGSFLAGCGLISTLAFWYNDV